MREFKSASAGHQHAARSPGVVIGRVTLVSCNAFDTIGERPHATISSLYGLRDVLSVR